MTYEYRRILWIPAATDVDLHQSQTG